VDPQLGVATVGEFVEELSGRRLEGLLLERDRGVAEPGVNSRGSTPVPSTMQLRSMLPT
jgi:hypothetical protein